MPSRVVTTDTIAQVVLNGSGQFAVITSTGVLRYGFGDAVQLGLGSMRVHNDGAIYSFNDENTARGIAAEFLDSFAGSKVVINNGIIAASAEAVYLPDAVDVRVINTGSIDGTIGVSTKRGTILNEGIISGSVAGISSEQVGNSGGAISIINSGEILGVSYGLWLGRAFQDGQTITVRNSGTVGGAYSIYAQPAGAPASGAVPFVYVIDNQGSMLGTLELAGNADRLTNQGTIDGDVFLQAGDDTFINRGTLIGGVSMGAGNDNYVGSRGSATGIIAGDAGNDQLIAGPGGDTLDGGAGNDALYGGDGGDNLFGGAGNDELYGHGGTDFLVPGTGADVVDGGDGFDWVSYFGATAGVVVNLADESQNADEAADDQIDNIEFVFGTDFADRLTGDAGFNRLTGNGGNDVLDGGGGADVLRGGTGNDTYLVDHPRDRILELDDEGRDTVLASVSHRLAAAASIERLETTAPTATRALNLAGNGFDQAILGNDGANRLSGGAGNDVLVGRAGNDRLDGGLNDDTLTGGRGADRFVLGLGFGTDTITDFSVADDTIEIAAQRVGLVAGRLPASAFRIGTVALDADDRLLYDPATGRLVADVNGSAAGGIQLQATLTNRPAGLTAADFLLI